MSLTEESNVNAKFIKILNDVTLIWIQPNKSLWSRGMSVFKNDVMIWLLREMHNSLKISILFYTFVFKGYYAIMYARLRVLKIISKLH